MYQTLVYPTRVEPKVKSSGGNYQVSSLQVGDRIVIDVSGLSSRLGYLANATGTIQEIKSKKAFVLVNTTNKYAAHTVSVPISSLRKCLANSTYAAVWAQDSLWQESLQEDSSCGDCAKLTSSAVTDCAIASPVSPSTKTCENLGLNQVQQTSSLQVPPASPSLLKENDLQAPTSETVSQQSYDKLEEVSPSLQSSKTCLDCYQPPLFPEPNPAHIFGRCSGNFMAVGTMQNGLLSEQPSTVLSGKEKGSCLLPRPGALSWSGNGRPPGNTKSEAKAKKLGILQKNQVYNPDWLELQFGLPPGWTSPQECRAATELLAPVELPLEIASMCDLLKSPLEEFSICPSRQQLVNLGDGCGVCGCLLGDMDNNPSKDGEELQISPSNQSPSKKRRQKGNGTGSIHWRTITKNGKDYPQAYYHWKENGQKKTKYIPKQLLGVIQEAEAAKRPVIEILGLLGVKVSPSNLLGDKQINPSNSEVLGDIEISPSKEALEIDPSNDISPSKMRRHKGEGSGSIHWRTITKGGKDYPQAYFHYEVWSGGDRLVKSSKYIPKRLLAQVQQLDAKKAPVREILGVLRVE